MADSFYRINRGITLNPGIAAPALPTNGDIYYDSTQKTFIFYDNGFWINLASRADVGSGSLSSAQFTSAVVQNSLVRITGLTSSILYGLAASTDAKQVVVYNQGTQSLLVKNQANIVETIAANRIITATAADVTILSGQTATFLYDASQSR